jgi:acetyl esterase
VTLDPQLQAFIAAGVAAGALPLDEQPLGDLRAATSNAGTALFGGSVEVAEVRDLEVPGAAGMVPIRLYVPTADAVGGGGPRGTLVWLHGGGWVIGDIESHDALCRGLAQRCGAHVIAVDYRLAPEHRFPAAVDDAWAALRWAGSVAAAMHGLEPCRVAVGGDSAGANLAAAIAVRARDTGLPLALQALVYPVVGADFDTPSYRACAEGFGLTRRAMEWFWECYAPGDLRNHPEASLLRAGSYAGVAPALVLTAEYDVLRSEGDAFAARLAADGVEVTHSCWDGMNHGFFRMPGIVDRADDALDEVAAAVRAALA